MSETPSLPTSPQLSMRRPSLADLPPLVIPEGYTLRTYRPGDGVHWERVIGESFGWEKRDGLFMVHIRFDNAFRPERVFFIFKGDEGVAASSAWYRPEFGAETGYLHFVGSLPSERGKSLGKLVSLACLYRMRDEGRTQAILDTDDFRVPAIKTYLGLGFEPLLRHENQRERWRRIFEVLGRPDLSAAYGAILDGPVYSPPPPRADRDNPEYFQLRRKWLPNRAHRGGIRGGGDMDFMADESLYASRGLGFTTVAPVEAVAGDPVTEPPVIVYTAGPEGVAEGTAVTFAMRGQSPLGFRLQVNNPEASGYLTLETSGHCELEPHDFGFKVVAGSLSEGETVTLRMPRAEGLRWNPVAGTRTLKTVFHYPGGEPDRRLPEPAAIVIAPRAFARLEATVKPTHNPGELLRVRVTARDEWDNRVPLDAALTVASGGGESAAMMARGRADGVVPAGAGVTRVAVRSADGAAECRTNPSIPRDELGLYFGDLHVHDFLSEAEGYPDAIYRWAIEDRNLDFVSIVPQSHGWHDNETWTLVKYMNERFHREGEFVTFLGFEWQHTGYGDKVVHFLNGDQPFLPVDDGRSCSAARLYEALRASDAFVISHHPAYPPGSWCSSTDFEATEKDLERVVEIWSMHGSCEGYDPADRPMRHTHAPSLAINALKRGHRLGFVAGSDTHSGRPCGSPKEPLGYWGGMAGVWAPSLTRRSLFEAIRARRTVALTGARIILQFRVNGAWMGSELPASETAHLRLDAWTPGEIARVEILKNGDLLHTVDGGGGERHLEFEDATGGPAFYHARLTQTDGHLAVCSPVWVG